MPTAACLPDLEYPSPFVVKNTFIDTKGGLPMSSTHLLAERKAQSCPSSGVDGHHPESPAPQEFMSPSSDSSWQKRCDDDVALERQAPAVTGTARSRSTSAGRTNPSSMAEDCFDEIFVTASDWGDTDISELPPPRLTFIEIPAQPTGLPDFEYPSPISIKNTFINTNTIETGSLDGFYQERKTQSCPASYMRADDSDPDGELPTRSSPLHTDEKQGTTEGKQLGHMTMDKDEQCNGDNHVPLDVRIRGLQDRLAACARSFGIEGKEHGEVADSPKSSMHAANDVEHGQAASTHDGTGPEANRPIRTRAGRWSSNTTARSDVPAPRPSPTTDAVQQNCQSTFGTPIITDPRFDRENHTGVDLSNRQSIPTRAPGTWQTGPYPAGVASMTDATVAAQGHANDVSPQSSLEAVYSDWIAQNGAHSMPHENIVTRAAGRWPLDLHARHNNMEVPSQGGQAGFLQQDAISSPTASDSQIGCETHASLRSHDSIPSRPAGTWFVGVEQRDSLLLSAQGSSDSRLAWDVQNGTTSGVYQHATVSDKPPRANVSMATSDVPPGCWDAPPRRSDWKGSVPPPPPLSPPLFATGESQVAHMMVEEQAPPVLLESLRSVAPRANINGDRDYLEPLRSVVPNASINLSTPRQQTLQFNAIQQQASSQVAQSIVGNSDIPTVGSLEHQAGTCRPCAYAFSKGCENGLQCEFCHLCPPGELKKRQKARRSAQRQARYLNAHW